MAQLREYGGTAQSSKHRYSQQLWAGEDAYTTSLLVMMMDLYGPEDMSWLQFAPETLALEVRDYYGVRPSDFAMDRLMAGIVVLTTDSFQSSLPKFIDICNAMGGEGVDNSFDIADTAEIAWTVVESVLLTQDEPEFSEEIQAYIEAQIRTEGLGQVPKVLRSIVPTFVNDPASDFADDPVMYGAVFDNAYDEAKLIDETVLEELQGLSSQLEGLYLRHGENTDVFEAMRGSLKL